MNPIRLIRFVFQALSSRPKAQPRVYGARVERFIAWTLDKNYQLAFERKIDRVMLASFLNFARQLGSVIDARALEMETE